MSIRIMSAVFESETLGPTERLIMLSLADHADDEGRCYPSIDRLSRRTGLSERAVQTNIAKLRDQGYIKVVLGGGKGRSNLYFISANPAANAGYDAPKPRTICTPQEMHPAADAPQTPQQVRPNPAADAPEPSRTIIEPSEYNNAREVAGILCQWASQDAVRSFIAYRRKQKGKALSVTAAKRLANQLKEIFNSGGDPDDALGMAEERGWQSVQAEWYFKAKGQANGTGNHTSLGTGASGPDTGMVAAFAAVAARRAAQSGRG